MDSLEEDRLFADNGWEKDLIQREWRSPNGTTFPFDDVVELSSSGPEGEAELKHLVRQYGVRRRE